MNGISHNFYWIAKPTGIIAVGSVFSTLQVLPLLLLTLDAWQMRQEGGRANTFRVQGKQVEVMEGDWQPDRVVIAKFESFDAAKAFYHSPEYGKARAAREGAAIMRLVCVEGL